MMDSNGMVIDIVRSLQDCGCDDGTAKQYLTYEKESRIRDQIRLLNRHRRRLMEDLHEDQKKVDRVDYLIRNLEQKAGGQL